MNPKLLTLNHSLKENKNIIMITSIIVSILLITTMILLTSTPQQTEITGTVYIDSHPAPSGVNVEIVFSNNSIIDPDGTDQQGRYQIKLSEFSKENAIFLIKYNETMYTAQNQTGDPFTITLGDANQPLTIDLYIYTTTNQSTNQNSSSNDDTTQDPTQPNDNTTTNQTNNTTNPNETNTTTNETNDDTSDFTPGGLGPSGGGGGGYTPPGNNDEPNTEEEFTITATSEAGGTINPLGSITLTKGEYINFTITPNQGYQTLNVLIDGTSKGNISYYNFTNINNDHEIHAEFKALEQPPTITEENPYNNSHTISIDQTTLSIKIKDLNNDLFNWTIEGKYVLNNGSNNDTDGIKSADLMTPLPYNTIIEWYVNASDSKGYIVNKTFSFTTRYEHYIPSIFNPLPFNNSEDIHYNPLLSVDVTEFDGEPVSVVFKTNASSGVWHQIGDVQKGHNGTYSQETSEMDKENTVFYWSVNVTNGYKWNNVTFHFKSIESILPQLKWSFQSDVGECSVPSLAADVDNDGSMDVIRKGEHGIVVFNGTTGDIIWNISTPLYAPHGSIEIIDLNQDGYLEILVSEEDGRISAFHANNGSLYWHNDHAPIADKYMVAGDINADGYPEVFVAVGAYPVPDSGLITALTYDGEIYAQNSTGFPCWGGLTLGDTDFDGVFELYQNDYSAHGIRSWNPYDLTLNWKQNFNRQLSAESHCVTLVDVDKDGRLDIVAMDQYRGDYTGLAVLNSSTGEPIDGRWTAEITNMHAHSQPTIYDIDNDGNLEIITGGNGVGHGHLERPSIWDLYEWDYESGGILDEYGRLPYETLDPPAIADITGDGNVEIIQCSRFNNNITIYNNKYELIGTMNLGYAEAYVCCQDLDQDGLNEIVINSGSGVYVYDTYGKTPTPAPRSEISFYGQGRGRAPYYRSYGPLNPIIKDETPTNNQNDVSMNPLLSAYLYDYQYNLMNVTIRTNASTGIWHDLYHNSSLTYGNYSIETTDMNSFGTRYWWSVNVTDVTGRYSNQTFSFTTRNKIKISDPLPVDGESNVRMNPVLSVYVEDYFSDQVEVSFMTNASSDQWYQLGSSQVGFNGTYSQSSLGMNMSNTRYWWSVNCTDGVSWTNKSFCFTTYVPTGSAWYDYAWEYRKEVRLSHGLVVDDLSGFPVLVELVDGDLAVDAQDDGGDIVFTDGSGVRLPHEIEFFDGGSGELVAWVNVSSLSSVEDTVLYLYYGNPVCDDQGDPAGVWDGHYVMVHHMDDATSSSVVDSSVFGNDGVKTGSGEPVGVGGRIGDGQLFDGVDDRVYIDHNPSLNITENLMVSCWFNKIGNGSSSFMGLFSKDPVNNYGPYSVLIYNTGYVSWRAFDDLDNYQGGYFNASISNNQWNYMTTMWDSVADIGSFYLNGELLSSSNTSIDNFTISDDYFSIGRSNKYFEGFIDEFRVSDIVRSDAWVKTSYNIQNNNAEFKFIFNPEHYIDYISPEIQDITVNPSSVPQGQQINITCNVTDIDGIDEVTITIIDPQNITHIIDITGNNINTSYYLNDTYNLVGVYNFTVTAKDGRNNQNTSEIYSFEVFDTQSPIITGLLTDPMNTTQGDYINVTCHIEDNHLLDSVYINITYPTNTYQNISVTENHYEPTTFYLEKRYHEIGTYSYFIWANDTSNNSNISDTQIFSIENSAPFLFNETPENNSTNVSLNPILQAEIQDLGEDTVTWYILTNATNTWTVLNSSSLPNGNGAVNATPANMNQFNTTFYWSVNCTDGYNWTNKTHSFTTLLPDTEPPNITDIQATPIIQNISKPVNITANITDNRELNIVKISINYNNSLLVNTSMEHINNNLYRYNESYNELGIYTYYIWAKDTSNNKKKSITKSFEITGSD